MYLEPKRFFVREMLLMLIGFGGVVITAILSGLGGAGILIAVVLNVLLLLTMLVMWIISVVHFIRYLTDKNNQQSVGMYLLNGIFSFFVLGLFIAFYIVLAIAGTVILLPFLQ